MSTPPSPFGSGSVPGRLRWWLLGAVGLTTVLLGWRWCDLRSQQTGRSSPPAGAGARDAGPAAPSATGASTSGAIATERMTPIAVADAPLFAEAPAGKLQPGELVLVARPLPAMRWRGKLDGKPAERDGPLVEVRRAPGEASFRMFQADLGAAIEVPAAGWICDRLGSVATPGVDRGRCAERMRRGRTADGALFAWLPCAVGPCPVALVQGGRVTAVTVDGIVDAVPVVVAGATVLLCTSRWSRASGTWTGGDLVAVSLGGAVPVRGGEIALDHVDARDAVRIKSRTAALTIAADLVQLTGTEQTTERDSNQVLASTRFDSRYRIERDGRVTPLPPPAALP
jgi:hypothetical protein